jgi:hypothetical protein
MNIPIEPNYRVVDEQTVTKEYHYSASGSGLGYDRPWFETKEQAETFARCLAQAFLAGKRARSRELLYLINDTGDPFR